MPSTDNPNKPPGLEVALFAGGCFWCMEPPFDKLNGVEKTISGYAGGHVDKPTYSQVTQGDTGHLEVIQIHFNPEKISYPQLLDVFWQNIDFLDNQGQFCDRGSSYVPAIFALNAEQNLQAEDARQKLKQLFPKLNTEIKSAHTFYPAENYHQDYYQKNPLRYKYYRWSCGRDHRLDQLAEQIKQHSQAE